MIIHNRGFRFITPRLLLDILSISTFAAVQVLFFGLYFGVFNIINNTRIVFMNSSLYKYNLFFTEDINGETNLNGCDQQGSLSRKSAFLKKQDDYLYFDGGNFTSAISDRGLSIFNNMLELNTAAINLTTRDYNNMGQLLITNKPLFFSANFTAEPFPRYLKTFVTLRNRHNQTKSQLLFITGITGSATFFKSETEETAFADNIIISLNRLYPQSTDADIKILFFNENPYLLKNILNNLTIHFDFVICQYSLSRQPNSTSSINGVPIIYPDYFGRSIAHVEINHLRNKNYFIIDYIRLFQSMPEDMSLFSDNDRSSSK